MPDAIETPTEGGRFQDVNELPPVFGACAFSASDFAIRGLFRLVSTGIYPLTTAKSIPLLHHRMAVKVRVLRGLGLQTDPHPPQDLRYHSA